MIKIFYQNVQSIVGRILDFKNQILTLQDYDIICLTETWLNSSIDTSELELLKNFHVFRSDRTKNSSPKNGGGGVLLAVNRNFKCTSMVVNEHIDQITVKIWTGDIWFQLYVLCIYHLYLSLINIIALLI